LVEILHKKVVRQGRKINMNSHQNDVINEICNRNSEPSQGWSVVDVASLVKLRALTM
jgi:hypothetical protein